jgi:hypothetical protein
MMPEEIATLQPLHRGAPPEGPEIKEISGAQGGLR